MVQHSSIILFGENMKKLHTLLSSAIISGSVLLTGCETQTASIQVQSLVSTVVELAGEHGVQLTDNAWLHYGPETTIKISDLTGNILSNSNIHAEYLAQGQDEKGPFVFAIDENNQPSLIRNSNTLVVKHGDKIGQPIEGVCLYQPKGGALQAFLMDENAIAHQVLVNESSTGVSLQTLRTFPLPPGSEYCAVHNDTDQLFVSEENIGVWRYSARAESQVSRQVVDLVAPYGQLIENSGPLSVINNTLVIAEIGTGILHTKSISESGIAGKSTFDLGANRKLENLSPSFSKSGSTHLINSLDDESGKLIQFELPILNEATPTESILNIPAVGETQPVVSKGDAADDPAIWVNPNQAEDSRIIGTNKKRGLYVYDLEGTQLQELLVDRVNNVDVRQGFTLNGQPADIAAASQRDRNAIALFHIHPETGFVSTKNEITTGLDDVYGLCMYQGKGNRIYVYINDEDGRYEQWEIIDSEQGWKGQLVRSFAVSTQPEGCTTDEKQHRLFVGEENKALWTLGAEPTDSTNMEMIAEAGGMLKADIEGMEVYQTESSNILVVSSQGNDSYVLFEANAPYQYLGRFRVDLNAELGIDGASETDGLTVTSANLGKKYPKGMLVVQDGRNLLPMETQNFKMISWEDIEKTLKL